MALNSQYDDKYGVHYIEGFDSFSEGETELVCSSSHRTPKSCSRRDPHVYQGHSPPLVLAFPFSGCRQKQVRSPSQSYRDGPHSDQDQDAENSDEPIEEWMILGGEELDGDRNIQLNLGYWSSGSSESDSGDEDEKHKSKVDDDPNWAISQKDKWGLDQSRPSRYYTADSSLTCYNCYKTGHLVRSCPTPRKRPTCVLCGLQGHFQRGCPRRHCPSCGLPSHGHQACPEPPVWYQHCHRCGMTGHLSDGCPDTWRQYHLTTQERVPCRPHRDHTASHSKRPSYCYNCSRRGHLGHECTMRRMISGTFPSLPNVCHYDDLRDILRESIRIQKKDRELTHMSLTPLLEPEKTSKAAGGSGEEDHPAPRSKSLEARKEGGRRKTWPERRKERREVKRLRREAQARREGGLQTIRGLGFDIEGHLEECFRSHNRDPTPPPQMTKLNSQERGRKSLNREETRKSREAERWKKRGGMKHGDLYLRDDLGPMDEGLLSPKHRVRHRRR